MGDSSQELMKYVSLGGLAHVTLESLYSHTRKQTVVLNRSMKLNGRRTKKRANICQALSYVPVPDKKNVTFSRDADFHWKFTMGSQCRQCDEHQ